MNFLGEPITPPASTSGNTDVRSPTRTEVRSPTRTATEVRSPTSTSTEAYTQGNFTATVTGGAGAGATHVHIHAPPLNRANSASSKGPRKNAQENENINAPRAGGSETNTTGVSMATPAQVYGHPDFITDVPVQGPTDQGLREADCWYVKNVLKTQKPACVDCGDGVIPMWASQSLVPILGNYSGIGERVSFGGVGALGFAFGADPTADIWTTLSPAQQQWIVAALSKLNDQIVKTSGTTCPTWGPTIPLAMSCFKPWFNTNYGGKLTTASGQPVMLPPTTAFDQTTLDALLTITGMNPQDFPTPYPGGPADPAAQPKKGLSTGAMVGIGVAGAAAIGIAYAATRGKSRRRR